MPTSSHQRCIWRCMLTPGETHVISAVHLSLDHSGGNQKAKWKQTPCQRFSVLNEYTAVPAVTTLSLLDKQLSVKA